MKCEDKRSNPWPFRPDHITCDGEIIGLNGTGIITRRHLQGFQSEICHAIQHPTTIVEFALDGTPIKTDSPLLTYAMHKACETLRKKDLFIDKDNNNILEDNRKHKEGRLCIYCDYTHACLFRNIKVEELQRNANKNFKNLMPELLELYAGLEGYLFKPGFIEGRYVLQYDCPLLGYRELLFPIIFEERIIGTLFAGQITLEDQQKFIIRTMESLPKRILGCFDAYLKLYRDETNETIIKEIIKNHERWISEEHESRILKNEKYKELIITTITELKEFESLLDEEINHQRTRYIQKKVSSEIEIYSKSILRLPKVGIGNENVLNDLWQKVETALEHFIEYFSFEYVIIFGPKHIFHTKDEKLLVVGKTKKCVDLFTEKRLNEMTLIIDEFPEEYTVCSKNEGAKYLGDFVNQNYGDYQLVLVPVNSHKSSSIAFLVGYNTYNSSNAKENIPNGDLDSSLKSFNTLVVSSLVATLVSVEEDREKKQLLYLGHEAGQLISGMDWLRVSYLADETKIKSLDTNKIKDLCEDIRGFNGQMGFIFDMAARIGSRELPKVEKTFFYPFGDVICKWKDSYRLEIDIKKLQLHFEVDINNLSDKEKLLRPILYADKFLFEQLVYNLVSNAQKYCYRGTRIHLDCKIEDINNSRSNYVLTVTNYGIKMPEEKELYKAFKRGEDVGDISGLGLGLYISSQIVAAHGGYIDHKCSEQPISVYNIPLIEPYVFFSFKEKDENLSKKLKLELERLKYSDEYMKCLSFEKDNVKKYIPKTEAIRDEINKPTYKVTLTATISR